MSDPAFSPTDQAIIDCLENDGVVLLPTDTVYGLGASPNSASAISKIYVLKGRPATMNLPVLAGSLADLTAVGIEINQNVQRLFESPFVPGALTLVVGFKNQPTIPWLSGRDEVAVRIPNHPRLLSILRQFGPILMTSANFSGKTTPNTVAEILAQLNGSPDLTLDEGFLETINSTIVNCRFDPPTCEREGLIPFQTIQNFLGHV